MTVAKVRVYTTNVCPYCVAAKRMLKELNVSFDEINLENQLELRMQLSRENGGWRTVPMIFIGETFIGGFTDMKAIHDRGELLPLIQGGA